MAKGNCTNFFFEEPDGYCTRCGTRHLEFNAAASDAQYVGQKQSTEKKAKIEKAKVVLKRDNGVRNGH